MELSNPTRLPEIVYEKFADPSVILIFPTEIATRFWIENFAYNSKEGVVRADKAIAWDNFRAHFLPKSNLRPTNEIIRRIFALWFLSQNKIKECLKYFSYPDASYPTQNLVPAIVKTIFKLKELEVLQKENRNSYLSLPKSYREDIDLIKENYNKFLNNNGLYEPRFFAPSIENDFEFAQKKFVLFFPEVCNNFKELKTIIKDFPNLEVVTIKVKEKSYNLELYPNEMMELNGLFSKISKLLKEGIPSYEIAVSVTALERQKAYLKQMGALYGIKLAIIEAKKIGSYASAAFFRRLITLYESDYSIENLKEFFLDVRLTWKESSFNRHFLRKVIEIKATDYNSLLYKLSLARGQQERKFLDFFKIFKELTDTLNRTKSIETLRKTIFAVINFLLDVETWDGTENLVFKYILSYIDELESALKGLSLDQHDSLFSLFVDTVSNQIYVPVQKEEAITVYPYTVSVGIYPSFHFIVGVTTEDTHLQEDTLPLIAEYDWPYQEREDKSNTFIEHYHFCGKNILFSAGEKIFGNSSALVSRWFLEKEAVVKATVERDDALYREYDSWAAENPQPFSVYRREADAFELALKTTLTYSSLDMATDDKLEELKKWAAKRVTISPSQLDVYVDCPLKWALTYPLKIKKEEYDVVQIDNLAIGEILHKILELFFKEVNLKTPYKSSSLQTYAKAIDKIALQVFSAYQNSIKSPSELTVYYLKELFIPQLKQIVTAESLLFEDFISTEFEYKLTKVYEEESYQLEGRIDRLTTKEDQVAIIDYKKKVRETLKSFRTDYDNLRAHQLPFYALLLKEVENREASIASYYDIQEGRYIKVWGEEEDELVETLKQIVKERIETMVRNLKEGSLGAVVTKQGCNYCDFREICRRRYALV